jgi:hypothetical protein
MAVKNRRSAPQAAIPKPMTDLRPSSIQFEEEEDTTAHEALLQMKLDNQRFNFVMRGLTAIGALSISLFFLVSGVRTIFPTLAPLSHTLAMSVAPAWLVIVSDAISSASHILLSVYVLRNRRGHYLFGLLYIALTLSFFPAAFWIVVFFVNRVRQHTIPIHVLILPSLGFISSFVSLWVDKEARTSEKGMYQLARTERRLRKQY